MHGIDPAATAWLLASTALVLLMTPGLAIFYGGMVRTTGVLNMIMMSFISIPLVTVAWLLVGYYPRVLRRQRRAGSSATSATSGCSASARPPHTDRFPNCCIATFQLSFAIVTAALVSGAIADRAKFAAWMVFVPVWAILRVCALSRIGYGHPAAGWPNWACSTTRAAWSSRSSPVPLLWLWRWCSARASASRTTRCGRTTCRSCLLGVGLLWFGWFGFNAGSALAANGTAAADLPQHARRRVPGHAGLASVEQIRDGRPTTFGAASGVVAGLVAITPSCGTVNTLGAAVVGLAAGIVCSFAVGGNSVSTTTIRSTWSVCTSSAGLSACH